ncbi:MAG: signal peptidase I [Clostridia bacterium]|nr:signal peptidase I [Clostridia bacterium]
MSKETAICWLKRAYMVFAIVWVLAFSSGFVRLSFCTGPSMLPTYGERNLNFMVRTGSYELTDVIGIDTEYGRASKRIVGCPGDHLCITNSQIKVNGKILRQPFVATMLWNPAGEYDLDITLGKDEYFVLGDNRLNSMDSRHWGPIKESQILGEMLF